MENTLSQKIDLEIAKIFYLANQINRKTDMCCFANDTAHCSYLEIRLHNSKQNYNSVPISFRLDYSVDEKYSWKIDSEHRLEEAKRCVDFLEKTLKEKEIDYSLLIELKDYVITSYEI